MSESWVSTETQKVGRRRSFPKAPPSLEDHTSIPLPSESGIFEPLGATSKRSIGKSNDSIKRKSANKPLSRLEQVESMLGQNRTAEIHHHYLLGKKIRAEK